MADGAQLLGQLWQAAWDAGDGARIRTGELAATPLSTLELYRDPAFIPSLDLDRIGSALTT